MSTRRAASVGALAFVCLACVGAGAGRELRANGPRVASGLTPMSVCISGADSDHDGLNDRCEAELARAFAPILLQDPADCEQDDGRPAGAYLHAVQRTGPNAVRVAYLPAYATDCGWAGAKCILPGVDCDAHPGDSEIIVVEVHANALSWQPNAVFLSAHCFDGDADDCRWYDALLELDWEDSRPIVWVSAGRHANYPSRRACDRGHFYLDSCDFDPRRVDFPVAAERNIGSAAVPAACVALPVVTVSDVTTECFWSGRPFRGWQEDAPGVTPYLRYLDEVAGFVAPIDRLAWLAGCWQRVTETSRMEEQWMAPRGDMMLGMSRVLRGAETIAHEAMRIEARGDTLVFVANPSGQRQAEFRSMEIDASGVVFENLEHDFPQRVIYRHAAGDSLHARIEGLDDGAERGIDFRMERTECGR